MKRRKSICSVVLCMFLLALTVLFSGCSTELLMSQDTVSVQNQVADATVDENGTYSSKEEVSLYIHMYGHLPSNYVTKKEAEQYGWDNTKGNLWEVLPGKSIGGDYFGNYEGQLPTGHSYKECDIDFEGGYRNAKRIIYSEDGMIFYTEDHYNTFKQLY